MKRFWSFAAGAVLLGAAAYGFVTWRGTAKEKHEPLPLDGAPIAWRTDLATARAEALAKDRALMVLFRCEP